MESLLTNSVETVLEVSIYTPVTSPVFFQLVVTNVSSSTQANLADLKSSLIWFFKIILFALGSKILINLFLVVASIKISFGLQETKVGVSSSFNSQNVSPLIMQKISDATR